MVGRFELLSRLSTLSMETVQYLQDGKAPDADWKARAQETLAEAKQPSQSVRYLFLEPLTTLVNACR